jgi:hypothetical protein
MLLVRSDLPPGDGDPGALPEDFGRDYLAALASNEAGRLGELIGEPATSAEVTRRLEHYGGDNLRDADRRCARTSRGCTSCRSPDPGRMAVRSSWPR